MNDAPKPREPRIPAHERLYRTLRSRIMHGEMAPGAPLTLRGLAAEFSVSMTPAREAVRRLAAEGALTLSPTGRVATPSPNNDRIEELASLRAMLEPELAARALPRAHIALVDRMQSLNAVIEEKVAAGDATGYVRSNLEFHRMLYLRAQAPAMLALAETVWLQAGPTMRALYAERRQTEATANHRKIIAALRAGDEQSLRLAVQTDVTRGLRMLLS